MYAELERFVAKKLKELLKDLPVERQEGVELTDREVLAEVAPAVLALLDANKIPLSEAASHSLARVHQHAQDREVGFITAHRGEHSPAENNARNSALKDDIRKAGFGHIPIRGRYIENKGTPEERKVHEKSFMVIGGKKDTGLKKFLHKHGEKYGQESVVHKAHDSHNAKLHMTSGPDKGQTHDLGSFHANKASDYQSAIKGKHKSFTFEEYFYITEKGPSNRRETLF